MKSKKETNDINNRIIQFKNMLLTTQNISNESNKLNEWLNNFIKIFKKSSSSFIDKINDYIKLLDSKDNINEIKVSDRYNDIKLTFSEYYNNIIVIYSNNYLKKIKELNENLRYTYNAIINNIIFNPPNENSFIDSKSINFDVDSQKELASNNSFSNGISHMSKYLHFYDDCISTKLEKTNIIEESICSSINGVSDKSGEISIVKKENKIYKCFSCKNNVINYFCQHCDLSFCENCSKNIPIEHKLIPIENIIYESEEEEEEGKKNYFTSIINLIKTILFYFNSLLIKKSAHNNKLDNTDFRKKFKYPSIIKENDFQSYIKFLEEVNSIVNKLNENNITEKSEFNISNINILLIDAFKSIFNDNKIKLIDNSYYSEDEEIELNLNEIMDEDDYYIRDKYYYLINIYPKVKLSNANYHKVNEIIINKINNNLKIDKNDIFLFTIKRTYFINSFIKSSNFSLLPYIQIKQMFPNCNKLYEVKELIDSLLINCKINRNMLLDSRGNSIYFNLSNNFKRGTERYYPPYNWIGIGIKVLEKYDDDDWINNNSNSSKWATAYHGLGRGLQSKLVEEALNNVLNSNLKPGPNQTYQYDIDKRHGNSKIGEGVYFCLDIKEAEEFAGIIDFNKKKYKIVLMARVLIEKIREPKEMKYFVLDSEYIRVYRILLKEI